jgi:hypothetical protein
MCRVKDIPLQLGMKFLTSYLLYKKKFSRYQTYADAQLIDLFTNEQLATATTVKIKTLKSVLLKNVGNKKWTISELPPALASLFTSK